MLRRRHLSADDAWPEPGVEIRPYAPPSPWIRPHGTVTFVQVCSALTPGTPPLPWPSQPNLSGVWTICSVRVKDIGRVPTYGRG
jgi:hypothetical protein